MARKKTTGKRRNVKTPTRRNAKTSKPRNVETSKPRNVKTTPITRQADLAAALNVVQSSVSGYCRRDDWPFGRSPWKRSDLPAMRRWMASLRENRRDDRQPPKPQTPDPKPQTPDPTQLPEKSILERQHRAERLRRERRENEEAERLLHDVAACERRAAAAIHACKNHLRGLIPAIADALVGLDAEQIRRKLLEHVDAALAHLKDPAGPFRGAAAGPG